MFKQKQKTTKIGTNIPTLPYLGSLLLLIEHDIVARLYLLMLWI